MKKIKFTKEAIQRLKPADPTYNVDKDNRYTVGDTSTKGLCVRVGGTGIKVFFVYKKLNGKPKRIKVGRFPDLTVEKAQKKASNIIGEMSYKGVDHNAEKKLEEAQSITLNEVWEEYKATSNLRPNTITAYKLAVERDFKDWKDNPLASITGTMVQKCHKELGKKSETRANKAMRTLRALFNFAQDQYEDNQGRSLFPDNPTRKLKRQWHKETRRKGYIAQHQLKDWFTEVQQLPDILQRGDGVLARDYLTFILLTGLRRREATSLLWQDIDLKAKRFIVRNAKNHDELWMPLSDYLVDMLKRRKEETDNDRPFILDDPRRFVQKVRDKSEVQFTIHDLRRTFITIAESLDIGIYTIKALVNHRSGGKDVTEGYVQINTERLREPMQRITDFILKAGNVIKSAEVVELKKKKI